MANIRTAELELVVSPMHYLEISAISNSSERQYLRLLLQRFGSNPQYNLSNTRQRAESFVASGIGVADSAHLAFAEESGADFITVDDRLLKQCQRMGVSIWFGSPLTYCTKESLT